jgi:hypothetical protein
MKLVHCFVSGDPLNIYALDPNSKSHVQTRNSTCAYIIHSYICMCSGQYETFALGGLLGFGVLPIHDKSK